MKKIIDKIADWLLSLNERKDTMNHDYATFMKRGKNGVIVGFIILGTFFAYFSFDLYMNYGKAWLASIPIVAFVIFVLAVLVTDSYKIKLRQRGQNPKMKLADFNMDFNEHILKRIYGSLTRYEYLDENRTTFEHFHDVMVLDFDEHESVIHFSCTQAELKYILEKFKPFKKGLYLSTFELSEKIYNKGELISAKSFYSNYSDNPPTLDFEKLIDSFFDF